MTELHEAVVAARSLANQFRGVLKVVEVLEGVGSLENICREAEEATAIARLKRNDMQLQAKQAGDKLEEVLAAIEDAEEEAQNVARASEKDREMTVARAGIKADQIVAEAEVKAQAVDKKTQEAEDAHAKVMDERAGEAAEARAEVNILKKELAALRERVLG